MRALLVPVATLSLLTAPCHAQSVVERSLSDELSFMRDEDPEMRRAFKRARETLDDFLLKAKTPAPGTGYYAVKVGVQEKEYTEYFWIGSFLQDGDEFSGTLDNTPRLVKNVREGQIYRFPKSHIVDWMYFNRETRRMHGNYTMCALMTKDPPDQAAEARRKFGLTCE